MLFQEQGLEHLQIVDGDISLYHQIATGQSYDDLMQDLIKFTVWCQERVTIFGKSHLQPRLSAWYGNKESHYTYSGISLSPLPWTRILLDLKNQIETLIQQEFNSVLLNYYRHQHDSMGMHSDDEAELGRQPIIASLSLGEERTFLLRHKNRKDLKTIKLPLPSGSLLVMKGNTQHYWNHGIAKERFPCGPRVNLTFRRIIKQ